MAVTVNDIGSVSFGEYDEWGNTVETYLSDVGQLTFYSVPSGGTTTYRRLMKLIGSCFKKFIG